MVKSANIYSNCVTPDGRFVYGIHKPSYNVTNLRTHEKIESLGRLKNGSVNNNHINFPSDNVEVQDADWIFEIHNSLPFRGTTYIDKEWADACASNYSRICLPKPEILSFSQFLQSKKIASDIIQDLPQPLQLTLATCSTDPNDLIKLASKSCALTYSDDGQVSGMGYQKLDDGRVKAVIYDHALFEAVANNPYLPDGYKVAMVLRPGAQGASEIIGDWPADNHSHVYEYLRRNSYIAGGHYAANMADDEIRYSISNLKPEDMSALRHLYYQRTYIRLAEVLGLSFNTKRKKYTNNELEKLRMMIIQQINDKEVENFSTLWGWNFGFDYAPTNYRLHASHQQIHQQYSMVPETVDAFSGDVSTPLGKISSFSSGDMVANAINDYFDHFASDLFYDYFAAIQNNIRMDDRTDLTSSLVIWQDENVMLFVPKAQTSQWELQLMTTPDDKGHFPGNILETGTKCRTSIDYGILRAQQILERLGARMVTSIEYSKRISSQQKYNQPLLYSFLPKLPQSPGAFSEAQLRFINGHYPEDFAAVCRNNL